MNRNAMMTMMTDRRSDEKSGTLSTSPQISHIHQQSICNIFPAFLRDQRSAMRLINAIRFSPRRGLRNVLRHRDVSLGTAINFTAMDGLGVKHSFHSCLHFQFPFFLESEQLLKSFYDFSVFTFHETINYGKKFFLCSTRQRTGKWV